MAHAVYPISACAPVQIAPSISLLDPQPSPGISFMLALHNPGNCMQQTSGRHLHPPAVGLLLLQEYGIHLCKWV